MALAAKMLLRQGQSLVMTPQLLQAIKLLQYSSIELAAFVEDELERNPLLERSEDGPDPSPTGIDAPGANPANEISAEFSGDPAEGDWNEPQLAVSSEGLAESLGTEIENAFDGDRDLSCGAEQNKMESLGLSDTAWSGVGGGEGSGEAANIEAYIAEQSTLSDYLGAQLAVATGDPVERMIGLAIIDAIDEAGYLRESAEEIADRLGASPERVEKIIAVVQTFEPTGIGARDLAECLAIQLRELDRYDPAMPAMIAHLPLVAKRDFAALRKICGVDDEDLSDMLAEIRRLDPKPGRAFGGSIVQPVAPDVIVRAARDGSWLIELNSRGPAPRAGQPDLCGDGFAQGRRRRGQDLPVAMPANRQLADQEPGAARPHHIEGLDRNRAATGRLSRARRRASAPAQPEEYRRRGRAARIDGFAGDLQQIHGDAARPVRAEIFLHRLDRRPWRRRRPFGRGGAIQDQADDRRRGVGRHSFG